CQQGTSIPWTF
nr:immunoglobulin light chain junction region [Macaca mulatta]